MEKIVSRVELSEDPALPGEILNKAESLFVAFQTGDFPYVLPFNHVWLDGRIYIHCALEGRKIDVLRRDGREWVMGCGVVIAGLLICGGLWQLRRDWRLRFRCPFCQYPNDPEGILGQTGHCRRMFPQTCA